MSEFVKVRQDGSVNIPINVRSKFGIIPGENFEISMTGDGVVQLIPHRVHCSLCEAEVTSVDTVTGTCAYCKIILTDLVRKGTDLSIALKTLRRDRQHKKF